VRAWELYFQPAVTIASLIDPSERKGARAEFVSQDFDFCGGALWGYRKLAFLGNSRVQLDGTPEPSM
jgi:hypothetical protein